MVQVGVGVLGDGMVEIICFVGNGIGYCFDFQKNVVYILVLVYIVGIGDVQVIVVWISCWIVVVGNIVYFYCSSE